MDVCRDVVSLAFLLFAVVASVVGCRTRSSNTSDTATATARGAAQVAAGFMKMAAFVRGDARIALGQTKDQIWQQLFRGKVMSHKPYAFTKPEPDIFERDVWILFYGPEESGMGRVDELRVTFTDGKASKLEGKAHLCP